MAVDSDLEKLYSYIYQNTPENLEKLERFLSFLFLCLYLTTEHADLIIKHNHIVGQVKLSKA